MQEERSGSIFAATVLAGACGPKRAGKLAIALLTLLIYHSPIIAKAESCPSTKDEISTDRPDVTNSSLVVPAGSLQIENGINSSVRDGGRFVDGTNTRLRLGIAQCLELLVDTPTYFANVRGPGNSGFSIAARMGFERNVHRVHSPFRPNQQIDHRSHLCDRKEGDREDEPVCGIRRGLPGEWQSRPIAELGWTVSPQSYPAVGSSPGGGAQPQCAQLHFRYRIFSTF